MSKILAPSLNNQQAPKRVKVTLACVICRKKKVKCDGIQPSCSRCTSIGNCCQYSDPPKKRGPPKGYVEVIENRAHRIESLLGNQQQQQKNPHNKSFIHVLSVDEQQQQQSANDLLCFIAGAVDAVRSGGSDTVVHGSHGIVYDFLMTEKVFLQQNTDQWTENFFTHFNFMFPILSRPQFTFQLEKGELNPLLKLAVFILGCRFSNNQQEEEMSLYQQLFVRQQSHDLLLVPDLSTIQAIVIMCWYTFIIGDMNKCYTLRHQLLQLITKLNIGFESDQQEQDIHFTEMKRRAFWVSFCIDQWLASCTGGERLFILNKYDCKWPQLEDNQLFVLHFNQHNQQPIYFSSIESALQINSFNEMIRLSKIVSDIINHSDKHLESNLTEWLLQLPCYLDYSKPITKDDPSPISKLYRILYYTVQIMLNTSSSNLQSTSICTTAANTIIHISEQMVERGQGNYLYNIFFLSLTLATSIHLDAPDKISLMKSISIIKQVNCNLLSKLEFDRLMDHFLIEKYGILLNDELYPSPTHSTSSLSRRKRSYSEEDDASSCSISTSPIHQTFISRNANQEQQQQFDLSDIFPTNMTEYSPLQQWPSWIDLFDNQTIESSCLHTSFITPSHSPSICLKEHDRMSSFDLLSNQHFFASFPLL